MGDRIVRTMRRTVRPLTRSPFRHLLTTHFALRGDHSEKTRHENVKCIRMNIQGSQHIVEKDDLSAGVNCSRQRETRLVSRRSFLIQSRNMLIDRTF